MAKNEKKSTASTSGLTTRLFHGRIITSDFFINHWGTVLLVCIMMLVYIRNRYECTIRMETIQQLEQKLEIEETELMRERATYMSRIRESSMTELVNKQNLGLQVQERPPYHIKKD
jgi:hypothetical protein